MSRHFYVIGNPIGHSLSPAIHAAFAREVGLDIVYETRCFEIGHFAEELKELAANVDVIGANVTVPFKLDAAHCADYLTDRAKRAGAVNTLCLKTEKGILGDNTDGIAFVHEIEGRQHMDLTDARILLLGAGGAARGLCAAIIEKTKNITIANRTFEKAQKLAEDFGLQAEAFESLHEPLWDIVVNATSASLQGKLPAIDEKVYAGAKLSFDLMYSAKPTVFMQRASALGCPKVADGLGMLVEQAAESFYLWNGIRPSTDPVYEHLRKTI